MAQFSKSYLSDDLKEEMMKKNIWSTSCSVSLDRLNLLKVSYVDFDDKYHDDGELMVLDVAADHVLEIFKELFENRFPIAGINLMNDFAGDDESMMVNNSSAFYNRTIKGSKAVSIHAYGLAIDINPHQNPCLSISNMDEAMIESSPPQGREYINRRNIRAGMLENIINKNSGETVVDIFRKHGFTVWGGDWNDPVDWQHFQVTRSQAEMISQLPYEQGIEFFNSLASLR